MRLLSDAAFDDVTIVPAGTLTADARLTVNGRLAVAGSLVGRAPIRVGQDLVVQPGGLVTHPPRSLDGLKIDIGGELEVQSGGHIDVDGRGLLGGYTVATQRAGESFDDAGRIVAGSTGVGTGGAGGSHGGRGGDGDTGSRASAIYGDAEDPSWLGSGGASGGAGGGTGGGRVTIRARACTVDGAIRANGTPGVRAWSGAVGGAGAGGSIRIDVAAILAGSGVIQADGAPGMCGSGCGGAGGGGRIAIDCGANAIPAEHITAAGGRGGVAGSAGTVHIQAGTLSPVQTASRPVERKRISDPGH